MNIDDEPTTEEDVFVDTFAQFKESPIFGELKTNFNQNIVLAAMVTNIEILDDENKDINEILTGWCMDHEDEDEDVEKILDQFKTDQSKSKRAPPIEQNR